MARKIQFRRGTAASWTSTDPTLAIGELGLETDTGKIKIGDGVTAWSARPYIDAAALAHIADTSAAHAAASIASTPAGTLAATDVQAALNELDTEKAPLASPALTGTPTAPTAATATNTTQVATTAFVRANRAEQAAADISQYLSITNAAAQYVAFVGLEFEVYAPEVGAIGVGTATRTSLNRHDIWSLPASGSTGIGFRRRLPSSWNSYKVSVIWVNLGTDAGYVRFQLGRQEFARSGTALNVGTGQSVVDVLHDGTTNTTVLTDLATMSCTADRTQALYLLKLSHPTDEMTAAIGVVGFVLTRVS